jgi:hypothetical protein
VHLNTPLHPVCGIVSVALLLHQAPQHIIRCSLLGGFYLLEFVYSLSIDPVIWAFLDDCSGGLL